MSFAKLIDELEERGLLSDRVMTKLREKLAQTDRPLSAKAVAKFLVEKKHITHRQATEVLGSLLRSGIDVDAAARDVAADDEVALVPLPEDQDDPESSSIFAPFLTGHKNRKEAKPPQDQEVNPAPDNDAAATDIRPAGKRDEVKVAPSKTPPVDKRLPRKTDRPQRTDAATTEVAEETPATEVLPTRKSARDRKPRRSATTDRDRRSDRVQAKGKSEWDSPLILLGGGALVVLLLAGGTIAWLLNWETGDEKLRLAQDALSTGSYTQAITHYQEFLEKFPRHREHSLARVQLAMASLRKATEASSYSNALSIANEELDAIETEEKFSEAHAELAALLPRIAQGLATEAEAASNPADAERLVGASSEALALASNTKFVPKSLRDESELEVTRQTLERVRRRQQSLTDLDATLAAMDEAIRSGDTRAAYSRRFEFVKQHPELAGDAKLAELLQKTAIAERAAIKFVADEQAAETSERPTPWIAALATARHRGPSTAADGSNIACVRVNGAAYGLDASTGRLLWRRQVGYEFSGAPVRAGADVLITDAVRHELLRLEAATGRLLWRQAIGEAFAQPVIVGERAFLAGESGRLHVVDLKSGARAGFVQFAQSLRVPPAADRLGEKLYVAGAHSNLYTLALADLACIGVYYLGHAEGSISVPPAHVLDKLAVVKNDGVETSRLHILSLDDKGAVSKEETQSRLKGLPSAPPIVAGRRLLIVTDRGQIQVYDVASAEGDKALSRVATREPSGTEPLARHVAVINRNVWIGDTQLTKYSILPTGNRLPVQSIRDNFAGSRFDHPLELFGETLVHVRRPQGRASAVVAATAAADGRVLWETELALLPAGPPIVNEPSKTLALCSADGHVFAFGEAAIRSRVLDQPLEAQPSPAELHAITAAVHLGRGRAAFCAPGFDRLLLYNPSLAERAAQWVKLESQLACAVTPLGDGFVAPTSVGQVFYLRAEDGAQIGVPFQPQLEPGKTVAYQPAAVVDAAAHRFVIADGSEKIYLVEAATQPQPHLRAIAEAKAGPYSIGSRPVVLGDAVLAVGGGSHLLRFSLPSLKPSGEFALPAPVVWGPYAAGNAALLATADEQLILISSAGEVVWSVKLDHGDLAGEPLSVDDAVLVAYKKGIIERRATGDGTALATKDLEHPLASGPVRFQQRLVISAHDGTLLVVDEP